MNPLAILAISFIITAPTFTNAPVNTGFLYDYPFTTFVVRGYEVMRCEDVGELAHSCRILWDGFSKVAATATMSVKLPTGTVVEP